MVVFILPSTRLFHWKCHRREHSRHLKLRHFDWFHNEFRATEQNRPGLLNKQFHFSLECAQCCACEKLSDGLFHLRHRLLAQNSLCTEVIRISSATCSPHHMDVSSTSHGLFRVLGAGFTACRVCFYLSCTVGYLNGCYGLSLKLPTHSCFECLVSAWEAILQAVAPSGG